MSDLDTSQLLFFAVLFAAVCLGVLGLAELIRGRNAAAGRRLAPSADIPGGARISLNFEDDGEFYRLVVRPLRNLFKPKDQEELSSLRQRLIQAGIYSPSAVPTYYVVRVLIAGSLPLLMSIFAPMMLNDSSSDTALALTIASAGMGYFAPAFYIDKRILRRQTAVRNGFPDSLDLLIICVEAGLGLDSAVNRVGEEIETAHPLLAEQFKMLGAELRAGKARDEAWRGIGQRTGVDEVKSLVTLLIQADALGTSTADALRAHASDLRVKRMLRAEEQAQKLGVKMTFPLIGLILPALMIVIGSPVFIHAVRVIGPTLNNIGH